MTFWEFATANPFTAFCMVCVAACGLSMTAAMVALAIGEWRKNK